MLSPNSSPRMIRRHLVALTLIGGALFSLVGGQVNTASAGEDLIRSAMIYNFCKFVQWPGAEHEKLVLGVLGDPGDSPDFSSIDGKQVQNTPIEIRQVSTMDEMRTCQLVFIDEGQAPILHEAFAIAQNESILTISEMDDFCTQGGIIQLVHRRGKMRFFINRQAAGDARLVLSSQLLKMAKIVEGS